MTNWIMQRYCFTMLLAKLYVICRWVLYLKINQDDKDYKMNIQFTITIYFKNAEKAYMYSSRKHTILVETEMCKSTYFFSELMMFRLTERGENVFIMIFLCDMNWLQLSKLKGPASKTPELYLYIYLITTYLTILCQPCLWLAFIGI